MWKSARQTSHSWKIAQTEHFPLPLNTAACGGGWGWDTFLLFFFRIIQQKCNIRVVCRCYSSSTWQQKVGLRERTDFRSESTPTCSRNTTTSQHSRGAGAGTEAVTLTWLCEIKQHGSVTSLFKPACICPMFFEWFGDPPQKNFNHESVYIV